MTKVTTTAAVASASTKPATQNVWVGRAWKFGVGTANEGLHLTIDQGKTIELDQNSVLFLNPNKKRPGVNPKTNQAYKDADFLLSVVVPKE